MDPKITITPEMLTLIAEIDEFKGRWTATNLLAPDKLLALRKVATIESIGSSTRIEGVKLTNKQIESLLTGLKSSSFRSRDEQEVAGYAKAMDLIFSSFEDIPLNENHTKQLHSILLNFSSKDERHRGEYKKCPNHVEAFDPKGKSLGAIFETTTPFETPHQMRELVRWTSKKIEDKKLHALLTIAIFIVTFLKVHPFQDGNGRLSRILTTLLLLKAGYNYVPYSSLERIVEDNKDGYYLSLRKAQSTLDSDCSGLPEWILFFLRTMKKQKDALLKKLGAEELLAEFSELDQQIIEILKARATASMSNLVTLTKANRNTLKVHLRRLVKDKYLIQNGVGKGTRYRLA